MIDWPFGDLLMFGYDMVMVDFPWRFETWSEAGRLGESSKAPDKEYSTLTIAQIEAMFPIGHLLSKDGVVWMWCTHPMIDQQIALGRRFGLNFCTTGVWVKRTVRGRLGFGTGYRLRCASEPFAIFTNGKPETVKNIRTVIEGPVREHSRKPDEAFREAERMVSRGSMLRCVELFSRQPRKGWTVWGDEKHKFEGVAS